MELRNSILCRPRIYYSTKLKENSRFEKSKDYNQYKQCFTLYLFNRYEYITNDRTRKSKSVENLNMITQKKVYGTKKHLLGIFSNEIN